MLVHGGVETLTITDATPGTRVAVHDQEGTPLVTLVADEQGNAHLIFLPDEHTVFDSIDAIAAALSGGRTLPPGRYRLVPDGGEPTEVDVLGVHDVPDPAKPATRATAAARTKHRRRTFTPFRILAPFSKG